MNTITTLNWLNLPKSALVFGLHLIISLSVFFYAANPETSLTTGVAQLQFYEITKCIQEEKPYTAMLDLTEGTVAVNM